MVHKSDLQRVRLLVSKLVLRSGVLWELKLGAQKKKTFKKALNKNLNFLIYFTLSMFCKFPKLMSKIFSKFIVPFQTLYIYNLNKKLENNNKIHLKVAQRVVMLVYWWEMRS